MGAFEIPAVLVLLGLALAVLPLGSVMAFDAFAQRRWLVGALLAAVVVRLLAPHAIVTMYIGYQLTEQAIRLATDSHYGVGSHALYHALFSVFPQDHAVLWWTNTVVGVLSIPFWAALASRLLRDPRAGIVFAWMWALLPIYIKNDNSDANNVPLHLWLGAGLFCWSQWLDRGRLEALVIAVPLLGLALISRPEQLLLLPLVLAGVTFALQPPPKALRTPATWIALLAIAVLGIPHFWHVTNAIRTLSDREALPGFGEFRAGMLPHLLASQRNTLLNPEFYPVVLPFLAAFALWHKGDRRARWTLAVLCVTALSVYSLDLCRANQARVHVLGSFFASMLAAAGLLDLHQRFGKAMTRVAVAALVVAAVPTGMSLWAPCNEETEETLIRTSIARLPQAPMRFVRIADDDGSVLPTASWHTHRHFPDYLVATPARDAVVESIGSFLRNPTFDQPVYTYLGMRCFAEFRLAGSPPPHGENQQPACEKMRAQFKLEPVVEQQVQNYGDVWLDYYGDAPTLRLGLYRVLPRAP